MILKKEKRSSNLHENHHYLTCASVEFTLRKSIDLLAVKSFPGKVNLYSYPMDVLLCRDRPMNVLELSATFILFTL